MSQSEDFRTVRIWRAMRKMSQRKFAKLVGVSVTAVHFWETGERIPNSEDRAKLCKALGNISEERLKKGPDWISADELLEHLPDKRREQIIKVIKTLAEQFQNDDNP